MSYSYSHNTTTSTTSNSLINAKKERQQIEKDVQLLANRIRALQHHETKNWKQIESTRKRTQDAEEFRLRSEEKFQTKQGLQDTRLQHILDVRNNIMLVKHHRHLNLEQRRKSLSEEKKFAYLKGRAYRDFSLSKRKEHSEKIQYLNAVKSATIKKQTREIQDKLKARRQAKLDISSFDYSCRIQQEFEKSAQAEHKMHELEILEMEFIKRLKNTHEVHKQVFNEFEDVVNHRPKSMLK